MYHFERLLLSLKKLLTNMVKTRRAALVL